MLHVVLGSTCAGYPEHFFTDDFGLDRGQLGLDPSDSAAAASAMSSYRAVDSLEWAVLEHLQGIFIPYTADPADGWDARF